MEKAIAINRSISNASSATCVLEITAKEIKHLSLVNCVTALQRLAKLGMGKADDPTSLIERATACFESTSEKVQPRQVSGCLWALAKLGFYRAPLIRATLRRGTAMNPDWFKALELSMAVWAIGKLVAGGGGGGGMAGGGIEDSAERSFLTKVLPSALRRQDHNSQGLSNLVSGLGGFADATPGMPNVPKEVAAVLRGRLHLFSAQELANTVSGLAKMKVTYDDGLAEEARVAMCANLGSFTPQNLSNAAWAITKLGFFDFWGVFAIPVTLRSAELNAPELSMCCWAAAQSLAASTEASPAAVSSLTDGLALTTCSLVEELDAQQLSTIALSLIKLGCADRSTLKSLSKASRLKLDHFKPQDLDNLASGFGRHELRWRSSKLVAAVSTAAASLVQAKGAVSVPPRNQANILTAVAKLASTSTRKGASSTSRDLGTHGLVIAVSRNIQEKGLSEYNIRDLANTAWGLAILGGGRECMLTIGQHAAPLLKSGGFNAQECSRLLFAMGKSGVRCPELEHAAAQEQDLQYTFAAPVGTVKLRHMMGGTQRDHTQREDTGAIAGNGGALFLDSFVLADWLSRQRSPASAGASLATAAAAAAATTAAGVQGIVPAAFEARKSWRGVTMVELGAGIGLCSIVAQKLGLAVVATDGDESVLDHLSANAKRNPPKSTAEEDEIGSNETGKAAPLSPPPQMATKLLKWGAPNPLELVDDTSSNSKSSSASAAPTPPDVIVATGCVYGRDAGVWKALVETLVALSGPHTLVIMAHGSGAAPGVHQLRGTFYELAAPHFTVHRAPQANLHTDHQGCQVHFLKRKPEEGSEEKEGVDCKGANSGGSKKIRTPKKKKSEKKKQLSDDDASNIKKVKRQKR